MRIPTGMVLKLLTGNASPERLLEVMEAAGLEVRTREVTDLDGELGQLAGMACLPRAKALAIEVRMEDGTSITGLLIMNQDLPRVDRNFTPAPRLALVSA